MEGNAKLAGEGLSQFAESLNQPGFGNDDYAKAMEKAIDYAQRLVQVAGAVDDPVLDAEVLKADVLSELVNLGGAYAALDPYRSSNSNFFLNTLWSNESIDKASRELEVHLRSYQGIDKKQVIQVEKNLLEVIGKLPSTYARQQFREASTVQIWMRDMVNYLNLKNTLGIGEYILDSSNFYESVISSSNLQQAVITANDISSYARQTPILISSIGNPVIISQDSMWDGINQGPLDWIGSILGGIIAWIVVDGSGQVKKVIFKSEGQSDDRTEGEKQTDKAIGKLVEGSIRVDKQGNPLKPGQKVSGAQNFGKPGEEEERDRDFDEFAKNNNATPKDRGEEGGRTTKVIKTLDGGDATAYTSKSVDQYGEPYRTISIILPRGRGIGRIIKIRYSNRFRATILIPVA